MQTVCLSARLTSFTLLFTAAFELIAVGVYIKGHVKTLNSSTNTELFKSDTFRIDVQLREKIAFERGRPFKVTGMNLTSKTSVA